MPELPEVETVRRGLEVAFVGRRIERVEVGRERSVRRTSREELTERLTGQMAIDARRRGKYLLFALDSGDELMIHLRMSGQVLIASSDVPRPPHCHVVLTLGPSQHADAAMRPSTELRFVDPRTFGEVIAFDPKRRPPVLPELDRLGIDPIVDGLSADDVRRITAGTKRPLKAVLLDQHLIAGIGNIYADEILHRARLHPFRIASSLDARAARRLSETIISVLGEAVESGGSTLRDARSVDVSGSGGSFQEHHRVYGRAGEPCLSCRRGRIASARLAGRATCWCPQCQPTPRPET
ncbi:MAG: bifunctional DNA-formamidopyrimidine glycosylase/DNA-(apurinic or apyrimidinic site) lyase [Actinomycetota bacterium]